MSSDFHIQIGLVQVQLLRGDITQIKVDAIVNAANAELAGGGGVDGAIHSAAGPEIREELNMIRDRIGRCEPGTAVVTSAGHLPAKWIFHAVGPVYCGGSSGESETLASCYRTCLDLAVKRGAKSISFPSISTGVYRFPKKEAASIALQTIADWLGGHEDAVDTIKLIQFSSEDHQVYRKCAENLRGDLAATTHG